jgi:hypothetical protein
MSPTLIHLVYASARHGERVRTREPRSVPTPRRKLG